MQQYFEEFSLIDDKYDLAHKFIEKFTQTYRGGTFLSSEEIQEQINEKPTFFGLVRPKGVFAGMTNIETYLKGGFDFHFGLQSGIIFYRYWVKLLKPRDGFGSGNEVYIQDMLRGGLRIEGNAIRIPSPWGEGDTSMHRPTYYDCLPSDIQVFEAIFKAWKDFEKYKSDISFQKHLAEVKAREELALQNRADHERLVAELDRDFDGEADLLHHNEFRRLLQANQKDIIAIDRAYVQNFTKISSYLAAKESYLQQTYQTLNTLTKPYWNSNIGGVAYTPITRQSELGERLYYLEELSRDIDNYHALFFHAINMVSALLDDNMMLFYELYEVFDQLGVFNSRWQNDVTNSLSAIRDDISGLEDSLWSLNKSIKQMEANIIDSIGQMNFATQQSFRELNTSVDRHLGQINSTLKFNTLLSLVQTYGVYKISRNTRHLK